MTFLHQKVLSTSIRRISEGAIADHAFLTNNGVYTQYAKLFSDTVFDTAATGFSLSMSVINTPNEQRGSASGANPWDFNHSVFAIWYHNARHSAMEIALMLKKSLGSTMFCLPCRKPFASDRRHWQTLHLSENPYEYGESSPIRFSCTKSTFLCLPQESVKLSLMRIYLHFPYC